MTVTSTSSNSPVDICSRALILIGAEPITSFDDGNNEALISSSMYEDVAQSALVNTRWRFATNQLVLNRLSDAPTGRYEASYQMPSDSLMIHALTVNGFNIEFQTYSDNLFCDADASDQVIADYTYRVLEQYWPSYFIMSVQFQLASVFAISLARDASLSQLMDQKAAFLMAKARGVDSQSQTNRKLDTSRFISNRRS
jgi:hypothetical protein|tara:strand:- start:666 stop:1259 length:594 start_codon:yes stop_codon:yes gene_type:complete